MDQIRKLAVFAIAALALSACTRSATSASVATPTQDALSSIFSTIATQTALASDGSKAVRSPTPLPLTTASPTSLFGSTATLSASPTTEATATNTPAPITEHEVPNNYTLSLGEWPYCLARRFDIDPAAILAANGLTEQQAANLSVGARLVIPVDEVGTFGAARQLRSHPTSYTTSGNDTFFSIACAFGDVWPENIAEANGMELDDELGGGVTLHIP